MACCATFYWFGGLPRSFRGYPSCRAGSFLSSGEASVWREKKKIKEQLNISPWWKPISKRFKFQMGRVQSLRFPSVSLFLKYIVSCWLIMITSCGKHSRKQNVRLDGDSRRLFWTTIWAPVLMGDALLPTGWCGKCSSSLCQIHFRFFFSSSWLWRHPTTLRPHPSHRTEYYTQTVCAA